MTKIKEVIKIKNKNKVYSVLFLLLLTCGFSFGMFFSSSIPIQGTQQVENPKSSAGEITIITPENKTYTEPDSGYYPATYGFENEQNGANPLGWELSGGGGSCNVLSSKGNHSKVMEFHDISSDPIYAFQNFAGNSFGTVESWWRLDDASKQLGVSLWNGGNWVVSVLMHQNEFIYWKLNSGWESIGKSINNNTWYHVRIDFECTSSGYQGLAQYKWQAYIDGTHYGVYDLIHNENKIDNLNLGTERAFNNYKAYVDAVGYSWDSNYNIGDNLNEGLLLSYENITTLDWKGFSLDNQSNNTISGNTTIPMPSEGTHQIQVFGNDSLGTMYKSIVRHFSVDTTPPEISITYPSAVQEFSNPPAYVLSITEENIAAMWYTLNGGANNPIASEIGTLDSSAWNSLADGPVTIRFYVRDIADREVFDEVIVVKVAGEVPTPPPGIPGYDLYLLIGALSIISAILIRKRVKS